MDEALHRPAGLKLEACELLGFNTGQVQQTQGWNHVQNNPKHVEPMLQKRVEKMFKVKPNNMFKQTLFQTSFRNCGHPELHSIRAQFWFSIGHPDHSTGPEGCHFCGRVALRGFPEAEFARPQCPRSHYWATSRWAGPKGISNDVQNLCHGVFNSYIQLSSNAVYKDFSFMFIHNYPCRMGKALKPSCAAFYYLMWIKDFRFPQ